jgi:hypothetical protein
MTDLRAPFPWFGAKSRVAEVIWRAFDPAVPNLVDPFCGSLATLLLRPGGAGKIETVNDADGLLVNFWRSVQIDPRETAKWVDWPISEIDVHARHAWLLERKPALRDLLAEDPEAHDPKAAGWWVWGLCQWIGGGWGSVELRLKAKLPATYRNHDDIRRLATHEMCHALVAPAFGVDGVRYLSEREAAAAWEEVTIRLMRGVFGYRRRAWKAMLNP